MEKHFCAAFTTRLWTLLTRLQLFYEDKDTKCNGYYVFEIFGEGENALWKACCFKDQSSLLAYLMKCKLADDNGVIKTRRFRRLFEDTLGISHHRPWIVDRRIHLVVLECKGCSCSGEMKKAIEYSRSLQLPFLDAMSDSQTDLETSSTTTILSSPPAQKKRFRDPGIGSRIIKAPNLQNTPSTITSTPTSMLLSTSTDGSSAFCHLVDRLSTMKITCDTSGSQDIGRLPLPTALFGQDPGFPPSDNNSQDSIATGSTWETEDSAELQFSQPKIQCISEFQYSQMKRTRKVPHGMQLSDPILHPERGMQYFLTTKGFRAELYYQKTTNTQPKRDFILALPNKNKVANKCTLTVLEKKAVIGGKVIDSMKKLSFQRAEGDIGLYVKFVYASLAAYLPFVSSSSLEVVVPFALYAYFKNLDINIVELESLRKISPSRTTFDNYMMDFAAHQLLLTAHSIQKAGYFSMSWDKGDKSKLGDFGGCAKLCSWVDTTQISSDFPDGQVLTTVLDADRTRDSSKEVAAGVAFSLSKLCFDRGADNYPTCTAATTDQGGGGTLDSVMKPLIEEHQALAPTTLIADCTLHNINNEQKVSIQKILLANTSLNKKQGNKHNDRDVEQMMYAGYAWEKGVGSKIIKLYWTGILEHISDIPASNDEGHDDGNKNSNQAEIEVMIDSHGKQCIGLKRATDTRWWTFGEGATILWNTLPMRIELAENYDKMKKSGKYRETCQTFLSLAKDPEIVADLCLVKCHHRFYIARHMKFFQQPDKFARKAGFQPFSIFVRVFLMREDYKQMITNYNNLESFKDLKGSIEKIPAQSQERARAEQKIKEFFLVGLDENRKLFKRWVAIENRGLAFLAAFSEAMTGRLVAQRLLGMPLCANLHKRLFINGQWTYDPERPIEPWIDEDFPSIYSLNHSRKICLKSFCAFVETCIPAKNHVQAGSHHQISEDKQILQRIAFGFDLWNHWDASTAASRAHIFKKYAHIFTNNQGTERANKDQNNAHKHQREELSVSARVAGTSFLREQCKTKAIGQKRIAWVGQYRIEEMITAIDALFARTIERMEELGREKYYENLQAIIVKLSSSFEAERKTEAMQELRNVLVQQHMPSAKEKIKGCHYSSTLLKLLQYGKLHGSVGSNLMLFKQELKGRQRVVLGRPLTSNEEAEIDKTGISQLKKSIQVDEESNFSLEYKDGTITTIGYNNKFFKPRHTNYSDWTFERV